MRQILFKAKRIDNGEWVEGHLIQNPYMGEVRSWISTPEDKTRLRAIATYYGDWRAVEVVTDTICQYTDLTDKNGKKIWENDIMKYEWDGKTRIEVIKYQAPIFTYDKSFRWSLHEDEVIGNIFDNADLLKGE